MMPSDVCLSVTYIGPKSRTERPRKTKIRTEVAHVTRDLDTTFKVKRPKVKVTEGVSILWRPPAYSLYYYSTKAGRERIPGGIGNNAKRNRPDDNLDIQKLQNQTAQLASDHTA